MDNYYEELLKEYTKQYEELIASGKWIQQQHVGDCTCDFCKSN